MVCVLFALAVIGAIWQVDRSRLIEGLAICCSVYMYLRHRQDAKEERAAALKPAQQKDRLSSVKAQRRDMSDQPQGQLPPQPRGRRRAQRDGSRLGAQITLAPGYDYVMIAAGAMLVLTLVLLWVNDGIHRIRLAALPDATAVLEVNTDTLEQFLDAPGAPEGLKRLLIVFSDAMADSDVVATVARLLKPGPAPADRSEATARLSERIEHMRALDPDLAETFDRSVGSAIVAAFRELPVSSGSFEALAARIVVDRGAETSMVAHATALLSGRRFGVEAAPMAA